MSKRTLIDLACQFGRLASGLKLDPGKARKPEVEDFSLWAISLDDALQRIYGAENSSVAPSLSDSPNVARPA